MSDKLQLFLDIVCVWLPQMDQAASIEEKKNMIE